LVVILFVENPILVVLLFFALASVCELFHYVLLFSLKWIIIFFVSIAFSSTNCFVIPIINFFCTNPPQKGVGINYYFFSEAM